MNDDMVGNSEEIAYNIPCETCINWGVEFIEDDSYDTCMVEKCVYEPIGRTDI